MPRWIGCGRSGHTWITTVATASLNCACGLERRDQHGCTGIPSLDQAPGAAGKHRILRNNTARVPRRDVPEDASAKGRRRDVALRTVCLVRQCQRGYRMTDNNRTRFQRIGYRTPDEVTEPDQLVLVEYVSGGCVAIITLNRAHADNAITTELVSQLIDILRDNSGPSLGAGCHHHRSRRQGLLCRWRPASARYHDEGRMAAPAPVL